MISNCDDVRGMFPWLLNGTLSDDERREVLQHLATCATCRHDLADTRLAAEIFDQHPPAEAILALAWDETPPGVDPALLEEHLASCPRCAAELELARMSRRLEEDDRIVPLTRRTAPAAPATGWRGWKSAALAAGLAGVVASAGWFQTAGRVGTLEKQLAEKPAVAAPAPAPPAAGSHNEQLAAELQEKMKKIDQKEKELSAQLDQLAEARPAAPTPQMISRTLNLMPSGDVARGGESAETPEIPARSSAVLLLQANPPDTNLDRAVEIVNASGKVAWSATGLPFDAENHIYALALPAGLSAGTYTIRIYRIAADG